VAGFVDYPASPMEPAELEEQIAAFPRWHYQFEFEGGVHTPVPFPGQRNRHEQRRRYFFDPLVRLLGGSLAGHRVLDLGCNAGFWSLAAVETGADFVLGIDARETFIEQAKLVFAAKQVDPARFRFEQGNFFEQPLGEGFDVVLCLGVMEVTAKPVALFELMSRAGAETILLDTHISRLGSSMFEVSRLSNPRAVVERDMVLIPTRQAVVELAASFGYETVPLAYNISDYTGLEDYQRSQRLAFLCSRDRSLADVPRASESRPSVLWRIARAVRP
jgi:tRNA (mo5U34)-methyltransferase